jgi:hypothetical protein
MTGSFDPGALNLTSLGRQGGRAAGPVPVTGTPTGAIKTRLNLAAARRRQGLARADAKQPGGAGKTMTPGASGRFQYPTGSR